jgi:hypothetical protein
MLTVTQQVEDFTHASVESAAQFSQVALEGSARLLDLQLKTAASSLRTTSSAPRTWRQETSRNWPALRASAARAGIEIGLAYREAYEIGTATRTELGKLLQKSAQEWQNTLSTTLRDAAKRRPGAEHSPAPDGKKKAA